MNEDRQTWLTCRHCDTDFYGLIVQGQLEIPAKCPHCFYEFRSGDSVYFWHQHMMREEQKQNERAQ